MAKIEIVGPQKGESELWISPDYTFFCPGCNCDHGVWTSKKNKLGAIWSFNGNMDKPTFSPSLLISSPGRNYCCHSFVTDGKIQFLSDCTHKLAGQTVELPEII